MGSKSQTQRLGYSLRRYFVDEFHFRYVPTLPAGSCVLDLGGNKILKRGQFNIGNYELQVVYANLSTAKQPDVQADAALIPFKDCCFDAAICSELLEHVPEPRVVLHEAYRVLRGDGILLICAPFLNRVHGDPYDYGRYTDFYWSQTLSKIGFSDIRIERQGLFWSVLTDMMRELAYNMAMENRPRSARLRWMIRRVINWSQRRAVAWESRPELHQHPFFSSYTTGFGVVCKKDRQVD